ncbi:MAG: glycosyltransferase family 2 protein [Victivallales bacterium]|nr:glycosyltransferase family 2 protein [Victivallales bacterium]
MPLFSIITPVFNVEEYLPAALDSVLAQTCPDWECLCVDDGSSDRSRQIIQEYSSRDPRIRLLTQEHGGVSRARNLALEHASGTWLCFLDSDDLLHPDILERCRDAATRHPGATILGFGFVRGENPTFPHNQPAEERLVDCTERIPNECWSRQLWSAVYRRDLGKDIRFQPYIHSEDLLFFYHFLYRAPAMVLLQAELYGYRLRAGSAVQTPMNERKAMDSCHAWHDTLDLHVASGRQVSSFARRRMLRGAYLTPILRLTARPRSKARDQAWQEWFSLARTRRPSQRLPWLFSWTVALCAITHSVFLTQLLLVFPARIFQTLRK